MSTSVPQVLGPYQLKAKLAVGGQSEVWLAMRQGPGGFERRCALKLLLPPVSLDEDARKAFVAEARLMAQFDHPNLIAFTDLGADEKNHIQYAVMPYLSGSSLATLIREQELEFPVEHALWIMSRVLLALHSAHQLSDQRGRRLDVIHRDVSPENVLVSFDGQIKLIDFGIALSSINPRNTRMHMVKGKLDYLSPEQAQASATIDHTTDIYSSGLLLYTLLTGRNPLEGDPDTALNRARNPRIPPVTNLAGVSEEMARIVHSMLDTTPQNRPRDARQLARKLLDTLHRRQPAFDELTFSDWLQDELRDSIRRERDFLKGLAEGTQVIETAKIEKASSVEKSKRRDEGTPILSARELRSAAKPPPTPGVQNPGPRTRKDGDLDDIFRELEEIYED